jgi:hypothetical protein
LKVKRLEEAEKEFRAALETDRRGNLNFENGYKHVMQLSPRGGYRKTEMYHSTTDIDLVIAMIGDESSVVSYKKGKNLQPTY